MKLSNLSTVRLGLAGLFIGVKQTSNSLNPLGMSGCTQLTSFPSLLEPLRAITSGKAEWKFDIPLSSSLVGAKVYMQGYALDKPANQLGITNSNGIVVTIG